jgi:hypothetical protein
VALTKCFFAFCSNLLFVLTLLNPCLLCVCAGIAAVFLLSGLLGLLQFYKFEGGKTSGADKLNEARRITNNVKRRNERGGGPLG